MKTWKDYLLVTLACLIFLLLTEPIRADEQIDKAKDALKDLGKYHGKSILEEYIDFNNDYIKYGGGIITTISEQEIDISLSDNADLTISEDNIQITWKKTF